jgi:hypothetical protein
VIVKRLKNLVSDIHSFIDLADEFGIKIKRIDLHNDFYIVS